MSVDQAAVVIQPPFLEEFQEFSDALLRHTTLDEKLTALVFLLRAREREHPTEWLMYSALMRRVKDQTRGASPRVYEILASEYCEPYCIPSGPYAPRVLEVRRLIKRAS